MDLPIDTESMLAQARKHKVGLILANQHMAQLKPSVRDAVVSNARSKIIFQSNANDSDILRKEIGGRIALRTEDMIGLQIYEAIVQLMTPPGSSPPMTVRTLPAVQSTGVADVIRNLSRQRYGRPLEDVRSEMNGRHQTARLPEIKKRSKPKSRGWGV